MRLQDREWSSEERGHWTHGHPVSWSAEIMDGAVLVLSRYLDISVSMCDDLMMAVSVLYTVDVSSQYWGWAKDLSPGAERW